MSMTNEDMTNQIAQELTGATDQQMAGDAAQEMRQAEQEYPEEVTPVSDEVLEGDLESDPLSEEEILSIITTELTNSISGQSRDSTDQNREESLSYYLGNPRGDEKEGRSTIVSTDVADVIEWILPQIIKALTSKGAVISFDALSEGDEVQAQLETEFTHDVFMKENPGFLNLYTYVKDALMYKNGVFKIYYDDTPNVSQEQYTGLTDAELQMLSSMPEVEITSMSQEIDQHELQVRQQQIQQAQQRMQQLQMQQAQQPRGPQGGSGPGNPMGQPPAPMPQQNPELMQIQAQLQQMMSQPPPLLSDVEVKITQKRGKGVVECIPLEEFRVARYHNSLNLSQSRFTAHVCLKTRSECLEEGFNPDIINDAPADSGDETDREFRFSEQGEDAGLSLNYTEDRSQELLEISECVVMIDLERSGIASLQKITVLGSETATEILDIEPVTEVPFVSSSTIIMQHKFLGLSIYDRLKQLQDQKTSLWRNIMDNLYLQNNREKEVVEKDVNLDDLLVSRPGGIKRVKKSGSIRELDVQPIGREGYDMLDYLDTVRTGRSGVSPDTAGAQPVPGSNVGSQGVERLMTAKEELTGLMVRVIAETGLKEAYTMLRDLLVRHHDSETKFKFKGKWDTVNPTEWGDRSRTTVMVGTGTGDDARRQAAIGRVIEYQNTIIAEPSGMQSLVDEPQIYKALNTFCVTAGLPGADEYFLDPESQEGKAAKAEKDKQQQELKAKEDALQQQMSEANRMIAEGEAKKGEAAMQSQQAKIQVEQMKTAQSQEKQTFEAEKAALEMELDAAKTQISANEAGSKQEFDYAKLAAEMKLAQDKLEQEEALKLTEMELKYREQDKQRADTKEAAMVSQANIEADRETEQKPETKPGDSKKKVNPNKGK